MRRRIGGPTFQPSAGKQSVSARAHPVVPLQRAIGNRATTQLLRRGVTEQGPSPASKSHASQGFTVKIKGLKQGVFQGDQNGRINGRKYHFGVSAPTDVATGHASGKSHYQAITFHKDVDGASPQLLNALTSNEVLTEVTFEFRKTSSSGESEVSEVVKLTNARLTEFDQDMDSGDGDETVSMTFEKIQMDVPSKGTSTADDWKN